MSVKLKSANGDILLSPEDGTGSQTVNIPRAGVGKVLQVVSKLATTQYTQALTALVETELAGAGVFTLSITPKGDNSKFKIYVRHFGEVVASQDEVYNINRDGVRINAQSGDTWSGISMGAQTYGGGINDDSTPEIMQLTTLDTAGSTTGTIIEYKVMVTHASSQTQYTNRTVGSTGANAYETGSSEIIIEEIGA